MRILIIFGAIAAACGLAWYSGINLWVLGIIAIAALVFRKPATELFLKTGIFATKNEKQ